MTRNYRQVRVNWNVQKTWVPAHCRSLCSGRRCSSEAEACFGCWAVARLPTSPFQLADGSRNDGFPVECDAQALTSVARSAIRTSTDHCGSAVAAAQCKTSNASTELCSLAGTADLLNARCCAAMPRAETVRPGFAPCSYESVLRRCYAAALIACVESVRLQPTSPCGPSPTSQESRNTLAPHFLPPAAALPLVALARFIRSLISLHSQPPRQHLRAPSRAVQSEQRCQADKCVTAPKTFVTPVAKMRMYVV